MTIRDIGILLGYKIDKASERAAEKSIQNLKSTAKKLLGAIGIGFSLTQINSLLEEFGAVNKGIKAITGSLEEATAEQENILQAANACHQSYSSMATTVKGLAQSANNLFDLDTATEYASTITKLLKTSGSSDSTISTVLNSLNSSFKTGKVSSGTISTLIQSAPEAAKILANHLGTTQKRLTTMASNGRIRVQDLKNAFLNAADEIDAAYAEVDLTITDSLKNIRNNWGYWMTQLNDTYKITDKLAKLLLKASDLLLSSANRVKKSLEWVIDRLGGSEKAAKKIATAVLYILAALNPLKAALVFIFLLVDDFMAFMQGENSVLGEKLKEGGYDVEAFRDKCSSFFEWLADHQDDIAKFGKIILATLAGIKVVSKIAAAVSAISSLKSKLKELQIATKAWSIIQGIANAVMAASPLQWTLIAITLLIGGIALLIMNWDKVKAVMQGVWDRMVEIFGNIGSWFEDNVISPISDLLDSFFEWILELPSKALQLGADIVNNLISGIKNAFDGVWSFLSGVGNDIKDFFGISSDTLTVSSGTASALTGSNGINKNVVQNVEINNTFNGDRAGQQKSEAAMSSASDDAVGAMARAMAYAR